jgi:translation elongation factor EF-4
VVDASQGIQAQTISNLYQAIDHNLEIIPVLNKIDMDSAQPDVVQDQVCDLLGCEPEDVLRVSARTGMGVQAVLDGRGAITLDREHPEITIKRSVRQARFVRLGEKNYYSLLRSKLSEWTH